MDRPLRSLYLRNLIVLVIVEIQTILSIVRFACGVIVSLKFDQKPIGGRTEFNLYFLCLIDTLLVNGLLFLVVEE